VIWRRMPARTSPSEGDAGFTLIELMVVVLIIAVLLAIGLPAFVGFRNSAQDRSAQSDLRNVLLAEKMIWQETAAYTQVIAEVEAVRPGSRIAADPVAGVFVDLNDSDDQIVCLVRASGSGRFFSVWESATGGAYFGATNLSTADCPGAVPAGYSRPGF
jgi:type IV pilus assembly protein PilA